MDKSTLATQTNVPFSLYLYAAYLRAAGFFPVPSISTPERFGWIWLTWSIILCVFNTTCGGLDILLYILIEYHTILRLEFFSIILLVQRILIACHVPFVYIHMIVHCKQVAMLLRKLTSERTVFRSTVGCVSAGVWTVVCTGVTIYSSGTVVESLATSPYLAESIFNSSYSGHFSFFSSDDELLGALYTVADGIIAHSVTAPHMFILVIAYQISTGFAQVAQRVRCMKGNKGLLKEYRNRTGLLRSSNSIFGAVILYSCLQDLVECVTFIAWKLQAALEQDPDETIEEFTLRAEVQEAGSQYRYLSSCTMIFTMAIRLSVFILCSERVKCVRRELELLREDAVLDGDDEHIVDKFLMEIDGTATHGISAGGFFVITKEYLVTVLGILLTYFLLIYQTWDSGKDMQTLLKSSVFQKELHAVQHNMSSMLKELKDIITEHKGL